MGDGAAGWAALPADSGNTFLGLALSFRKTEPPQGLPRRAARAMTVQFVIARPQARGNQCGLAACSGILEG